MHHKRLSVALGVFGVCALGLTAWFFGVATGSAAGKTATHAAAKVTVITVTAGQPTELGFKLSKFSLLPSGPITFKVTNKGVVTHDFKICTSAVTSLAKNSCTGKVTKMLASGQSATLTVTLKAHGKYEFLCTVAGHAGAGMKGLLGVGVKVTAPASANASATGTKSSTSGSSAGAGTTTTTSSSTTKTCANPQTTNVDVNMFDYGFTITPSSAPCGKLVITQRNTGNTDHNFNINGQAGAIIGSGQSSTFTANLTPGSWSYQCDVPGHVGLGMGGNMTITG
jgi:uncharacterized cupredoxin-like copper-binding protein